MANERGEGLGIQAKTPMDTKQKILKEKNLKVACITDDWRWQRA